MIINKRTKPVNIRVSEEEFQKLHDACDQIGTRNVSELARKAMRLILDEHRSMLVSGKDTMVWLDELGGRLTTLQSEVQRLKSLLRADG